ncbi:F0F1 ATP synthase subunit delta [Singulisphaera rosea]
MLNGWFTIAAQVVNFLILVWLFKRFLYKPILNAIDEREKGIAAQLAAAEATQVEARKDRDGFQQKNDVFDKERAVLLKKATDEAKSERDRLLDQARKDADSLRANRQEALLIEQKNLSRDIARWTHKEVFAIARRTLTDLADASLEQRIGDVFVDRVRALSGEAKEPLATSFKTSNRKVSVRSAFDLSPAQRTAIESAVKETFAPDAQVQFATAPELVSGIELTTNGLKIAWSIADYLSTLEKSAGELLNAAAKPAVKAEPVANGESKAAPKADARNVRKAASSAPKVAS